MTSTLTGDAADEYARERVGGKMPDEGLCLQCARQNFNIPGLYASAKDAWYGASGKSTQMPPSGSVVPVWFDTASQYGHVATRLENGQVQSSSGDDIRLFDSVSEVARLFGGPYVGWAPELNGVTVWPVDDDTPVPPEEDPAMRYLNRSSSAPQQVPGDGKWYQLGGIGNLMFGPGLFTAVTQLRVGDLPEGRQLTVRYVLADTDADGYNAVVSSAFPYTEIIGSSGDTYGTAAQVGSVPSPSPSQRKVLRVQVQAYDPVTIESAAVRLLVQQ